MESIIEHVRRWSGALFEERPLGEADALVLSTLAYMPFDGIVDGAFGERGVLLADAAQALLDCHACARVARDTAQRDRQLLTAIAESERFGGMRLTGFIDRYDGEQQEQFSAVTFLYGEEAFLALRGTDGTIVGWKEDFNMSFEREVPAQRDAARYARDAWRALGRRMTLGGHSKGGNLAAYAGIFAQDEARRNIAQVYSFDGPGFNEQVVSTRTFAQAQTHIRTFVPQESLVGILLWHSEPFTVVESNGQGILQHDPYTWLTRDGKLVRVDARSNPSLYAGEVVKRWLAQLPTQTRRRAIDGLYAVIGAAKERSVRELLDVPSALAMLEAAGRMDGQTREALKEMLELLIGAAAEAAPRAIERAVADALIGDGG